MLDSICKPQGVVYLSRRNLLTLLSKLDRLGEGEDTACAIIKSDNAHEKYPQTMESVMICAIEDAEYYGTSNRSIGAIHPSDESALMEGIRYDRV